MGDPKRHASGDRPAESSVCDEIGRAVGSVWQRSSGVRPTRVHTEYVGDVVRCTIEEQEAAGDAEDGATPAPVEGWIESYRYRSGATSAVARLTGRRVVALVAKRAADETTTNTFILETLRVKY